MDKVISSPLTYWGGKRWLFKTLLPLIPEGTTEIFSPFLGGGSIEINLAHRGYTVHAYDNYAPLVNFWQHWLDDPEAVRLAAYELLSLYTNEDLNRLRYDKDWMDGLQAAGFYYLQNQLSFNGMPNRTLKTPYLRSDGEYCYYKGVDDCRRIFKHWEFWQPKPCQKLNIKQADFERVFWIHNHQFAYVDPPYFQNEKDYEGSNKNGFNHERLRNLLGKRGKWVLSYNDHPKAYELYDGFHIKPMQRPKGQSNGGQELLILSHDIAEMIPYEPSQLMLW